MKRDAEIRRRGDAAKERREDAERNATSSSPRSLSSLRPHPSSLASWTLSAPGIHGECVAMRAHPDDFRRRTLEGEIAGADLCDWPLTFAELEPYYEEVEEALQIAGPTHYPWGKRRKRYPQREHELNASAQVLVRGCTRLG